MRIDRRLLLKGAAAGAGVLALPAWAQAFAARGFTHNVASGEPGPDRVMLWTRYLPEAGGSGMLRWQVASDAEFSRVLAEGQAEATPERDWCVKPVATGLAPGGWYYYRFLDAVGQASAVGRTRTLPDGAVGKFTLGVFSCANLPFGYFNAYAHAAARPDLDLLVHLGDYLYEYQRGVYPSLGEAVPERPILPQGEAFALADYRLRYATYRSDPDLQRLHQLFPMIMMWDDHESANDSWRGGAQNHQPATEGDWEVRKAASMRACREWLPVSEESWASYRIGDLADLFRPETRLSGRVQQLNLGAFLEGRSDIAQAFADFRDGPWQSPQRTMLGLEQEAWLAGGLRRSVADGVKWQVLCQQVIMGSMSLGPELAALRNEGADAAARAGTELSLAASRAGLPLALDIWDGYPAARARLLKAGQEAAANLIVLSGDSHNAWAFELDQDGKAAGAEFAGHSVSSPGKERGSRQDPATLARAYIADNRQLKWAETSRRGYVTLELTPGRATGEWVFMDTVRQPSLALASRHALSVARGTNRFAEVR